MFRVDAALWHMLANDYTRLRCSQVLQLQLFTNTKWTALRTTVRDDPLDFYQSTEAKRIDDLTGKWLGKWLLRLSTGICWARASYLFGISRAVEQQQQSVATLLRLRCCTAAALLWHCLCIAAALWLHRCGTAAALPLHCCTAVGTAAALLQLAPLHRCCKLQLGCWCMPDECLLLFRWQAV